MNRSEFIHSALLGFTSLSVFPIFSSAKKVQNQEPLDSELVRKFVGAGHNDLPMTRKLLDETPNLIYARYDWGMGDFEEAIEGAGHVGDKEIVRFLISRGARVNLFVLTMLGYSDLVIPVLEAFPELIHAKGAHGFTLLHHAKVGGEDSAKIFDYLADKGLDVLKIPLK